MKFLEDLSETLFGDKSKTHMAATAILVAGSFYGVYKIGKMTGFEDGFAKGCEKGCEISKEAIKTIRVYMNI